MAGQIGVASDSNKGLLSSKDYSHIFNAKGSNEEQTSGAIHFTATSTRCVGLLFITMNTMSVSIYAFSYRGTSNGWQIKNIFKSDGGGDVIFLSNGANLAVQTYISWSDVFALPSDGLKFSDIITDTTSYKSVTVS